MSVRICCNLCYEFRMWHFSVTLLAEPKTELLAMAYILLFFFQRIPFSLITIWYDSLHYVTVFVSGAFYICASEMDLSRCTFRMWDTRFSQQCVWKWLSSEMLNLLQKIVTLIRSQFMTVTIFPVCLNSFCLLNQYGFAVNEKVKIIHNWV